MKRKGRKDARTRDKDREGERKGRKRGVSERRNGKSQEANVEELN